MRRNIDLRINMYLANQPSRPRLDTRLCPFEIGNQANGKLRETDMFAVRGVPPLLILLTIFVFENSATRINHQDLDPVGTSHLRHYQDGERVHLYAARDDKAGDRNNRGYKSYHSADKFNKDQHTLNNNYGHYDKEEGGKKHRQHNDGHYGEHHEGTQGEKGGKFHDKGHYGKGHRTHGQHEVKKLDEYRKTKEFNDEDYDYDYDKQDRGQFHNNEQMKSGHYKGVHHDHNEHEIGCGNSGHHTKGHHHKDHKGRENNDHHVGYYHNDDRHGKEVSQDSGTKWGYKKD